jgi:hypothetical protein
MRQNLHHIFILILFSLSFTALGTGSLYAQQIGAPDDNTDLTEEELRELQIRDSINQREQRLEERKEKDKKVEDKVVIELNKKRFTNLSRKWWGMPTETDQEKIDRGRYLRYYEPQGVNTLLASEGAIYRHQKEITNDQNLIVWGWHPYWSRDAFKTYDFSLLTHVGFYGYELNPFTGGYTNFDAIHEFRNSELIQVAHKDSCKVLLTLACHKPEKSEIFFTSNPIVRQNTIDSLKAILFYTYADGVEINFEEVPAEFKADFKDFVRELSFQLREFDPNITIAMTLPLYDPKNVYDIGFYQHWVDLFIIAGYNFHLRPTGVTKGALTPLHNPDAEIRGSYMTYMKETNLDSVLRSPGTIRDIQILQSDAYLKTLLDTLNAYITRTRIEDLEYNRYDIGDVLGVIRKVNVLRDEPNIRRALRRTVCRAKLAKYYLPKEKVNFYLFEPEWDTVKINEFDIFNKIDGVLSEADSLDRHLETTLDKFIREIGTAHASSLVLGLSYQGAVWQTRGTYEFTGYMPYAEIRNLVRAGKATVRYDKVYNSMIATISDTLGPYQEVYFDNSTSLGLKMDEAMDKGLGGVALWALSYDHGYKELWRVIEEQFASRMIWNAENERWERFKIAKSNKIHYTVTYQMKRISNLIFATLVFMTIFMTIGFAFSLLDWRVRDVMFYSGAFRIFYLTIFTVLILVIGSYLGLFQNRATAFLVGIILGGILTWLATVLVVKRQEKLP